MCELITKEQIKRKIKENTAMYYKQKQKSKELNEDMLMAKTALKNYQILFWNHKELHSDSTFIVLYADINCLYKWNKAKYIASCSKLKFYKQNIKNWNSQLGKLQHG